MDLTTAEGVASLMSSSTTDREWRDNCDKVKAANGGDYPSFWWNTIVKSGLMDRTLGQGASQLRITTFKF